MKKFIEFDIRRQSAIKNTLESTRFHVILSHILPKTEKPIAIKFYSPQKKFWQVSGRIQFTRDVHDVFVFSSHVEAYHRERSRKKANSAS